MEKKVEEIVNKTKSGTVNDLLTLFNSKNESQKKQETEEFKYKLEEIEINQPSTISGCAFPNIVIDEDLILSTFNGISIFYDEKLTKMHTTVISTRDMCVFRSGKKAFLVTLDQFNKLSYSEIKDGVIQSDKPIISRNVLQLIKYHEKVYFISFKKDLHTLNMINLDDRTLRPKIIVPQIQVKYSISVFPTQFGIFMKLDKKFAFEDPKKCNVVADGALDFKNDVVVYKLVDSGVKLTLLNNKFEEVADNIISINGNIISLQTLGDIISIRTNVEVSFIDYNSNGFMVTHKMTYAKYPAAIAFKLDDDIIKVYSLYCSESKITQKQKVELVGSCLDQDLPKPNEESRLYDPLIVSPKESSDLKNIVEDLFKRLEGKIMERENSERLRQNELLDKISEQLNSSLIKVVQKVIKYEIETVQRKLLFAIESKINANDSNRIVDETKVLQFTKEIICNTLLPVVEASMDEMRIQVLNEFKKINNKDHLEELKTHLSTLGLTKTKESVIMSLISQNKIEECVLRVVEASGESELEEFLLNCKPCSLVDVKSSLLIRLLEKVYNFLGGKEGENEVIREILSDIELASLSDNELVKLEGLLGKIKSSELVERPGNENIIVLCDYLNRQVTKLKRSKNESNEKNNKK